MVIDMDDKQSSIKGSPLVLGHMKKNTAEWTYANLFSQFASYASMPRYLRTIVGRWIIPLPYRLAVPYFFVSTGLFLRKTLKRHGTSSEWTKFGIISDYWSNREY